jgi:probable selenium-dependent hydroxylase accessory protein YqeC
LEKAVSSLKDALGLEEREHLALVGGGGKTSLMFAMAEELRQSEKRVVTSTTTKIWHHEALNSPLVLFLESDASWSKLKEELSIHGHVFLAQSLLDSGKVSGISPSIADELYQDEAMDYLLVEADGSAGHPVKAPAEHEPVIPPLVTKAVAMMGLEAIDQPLGPDTVFRVDLFRKITGLDLGQRLTPPVLSRLFQDPKGLFKGTPPSAKRVAFLNKLDLLAEEQEASDLAHEILGDSGGEIDRVVIGSIKKGIYLVRGVKR